MPEFECELCGGRGCEACGDSGVWTLTDCPHEFVGGDTIDAMRFADMAKQGAWPEPGGTLSQSQWFIDFCHTYWLEMNTARAKHGGQE